LTTTVDATTDGLPSGQASTEDLVAALVGPDKKFKSVQDLARGKLEADSFIKKVTEENNALRALIQNSEENNWSSNAMTDLLARVSQGSHQVQQPATETKVEGGAGNQPQALTSSDVEILFKNLRQKEHEDANEKTAFGKLAESFGADKVEEVLQKKAASLGLDVDTLKATARKSPTAFANLIGDNRQQASAPATGRNTSAVPELAGLGSEPKRDRAYYDKLKNEMGVKKFMLDKSLQVQLHRDMMTLGDAWEG
jgi:hypothetical protein